MKRIFTILLLSASFFITPSLKAQVIFLQTFDNIPGPTAGGPGTFTFPAGWLLANVDNHTPAIPLITNAWIRSDNGAGDTVAVSTSYYTPPGQADDWMWTPAINVIAGNFTRLSWDAIVTDSDFPDGYEVRIMTIPPSGSKGNIGNMLTASTQLLNIPAENAQWINRSVDISSYNGRTVYIGFRNHSYDDYLLAINNVKVEKLISLPVLLVSFTGIKTLAGNDLRWETSQQKGIQQYDIERSTDGTHFGTIGSVKANQETSFTYRYNDAEPLSGINFYRLKIIEYNGETYSEIIRITNSNSNMITLSPNPAKNYVMLQTNNSDILNTKAKLTTIDGKILKEIQISQLPYSIDVSSLSKGIYLLQLEDKSVLKIVKE